MRIYIAHPYTGDEEKNRERAKEAEELLHKATPWVFFYNPARHVKPIWERTSVYFEELLKCNGVVLCGDWMQSEGCRLEAKIAKKLKMPRWYGVDAYVKMWAQIEDDARKVESAI